MGVMCLAGCTCSYRECPSELPAAALISALGEAGGTVEFTDCVQEQWWSLFDDDQLSYFITLAHGRNPTLRQAYGKVLLAAAHAERVRSVLFPNILWAADVSRQKLSETGLIPFTQAPASGLSEPSPAQLVATGGAAGIPVYFTQTETEFNLSYDFDIWHKNRNTWRAALDEVQANIADEAFARLQLGVAVALTYYQLQVDYKRLEVAKRLVDLDDRLLALTHERVGSDLDTSLNVQNARSNLSTAKLSFLQLQGSVAVAENKLRTYLAGQFDEQILELEIIDRPLPKVPLPKDLPLHLIAHRPDIMAQLWLIESAGKQIEVAKAGFYPDVNINALFGYQTIHLHKLFEWPSVFFNVDPAISLPFFDGGRLAANLRGSEINYDLAIYEYNERVLNAVHEVLDGLVLVRNTDLQLQEQRQKLAQQEELYRLTVLRVENNLDSDLDALLSEAQMLAVRDQELIVLGSAFQAIIGLIKAVGGGYEACYTEG